MAPVRLITASNDSAAKGWICAAAWTNLALSTPVECGKATGVLDHL